MVHKRGRWNSSRGQTLIEFALITPVVIIFMIAIIDFGAAMNRRLVLQHAVSEGARMAIVTDVSKGDGFERLCTYTCEEAQGGVKDGEQIAVHYDGFNAGDNVIVTIPAEWPLPILSTALGGLFDSELPKIKLTAKGESRLSLTLSGPWPADQECPPCP